MTLDQYIEALESIRAEHGGKMQVNSLGFNGGRMVARLPCIAHTLILENRDRLERFWHPSAAGEDRKGEKVVRV